MKFAVRDPQTAPTLPALLRYKWSFPKPINVMQHVASINKVIKGAHNITFKEKKKKKERKKKQQQKNKFNHRLYVVRCNHWRYYQAWCCSDNIYK